ncbi:LutC/YkgG family protein [Crateriforma spongiae]|uniref:LutC/YkgG family protein n=1 Tax=Crateriforma spongiae TaxID=2724528 RepID=UPI0028F41CE5|nr:LUD domain-containing protein [Crateriforma spongiae]
MNESTVKSSVTATTDSRRAIMDRLRGQVIDSEPIPPIDLASVTQFDDPLAVFQQNLQAVGGESHLVDRPEQVAEILRGIDVFSSAGQICSLVPDAVDGNVDASAVDDPHEFAPLDWTIAPGQFAVAENGAIWIDGATLPHRVLIFIAQYLAIVVSRSQIVSNMHQAYQRIGNIESPFGVFVSGPSKTADIEQSLVLGAHGCRKLQVFLLP